MDSVHERIKRVRKEKGIRQEDFANSLNLKRSSISSMENGKINPSNRTISDICLKYGVNEDWLRNGGSDEEIYIDYPEEVEIAKYVESLLTDTDDSVIELIKNFLVIYKKLDNTSQEVLRGVANELLSKKE